MEPTEINDLNELKAKCLKKDGNPKAKAKNEDLKRLAELQKRYDDEHSLIVPNNARIEHGTREILLNVCGKQIVKTVPK